MASSFTQENPKAKTPLHVVYLHCTPPPAFPPTCLKHYGLSAGLIADRESKIATLPDSTNLSEELKDVQIRKCKLEIQEWTACYKSKWRTACLELATACSPVEAFLAFPSDRHEVSQILIEAFAEVNSKASNLSGGLRKPANTKLGSIKDIDKIIKILSVDEVLKSQLTNIKTLLIVDDWFGSGSSIFAAQALLNSIAGRDLVTTCAVPGVSKVP